VPAMPAGEWDDVGVGGPGRLCGRLPFDGRHPVRENSAKPDREETMQRALFGLGSL